VTNEARVLLSAPDIVADRLSDEVGSTELALGYIGAMLNRHRSLVALSFYLVEIAGFEFW
jgi:hypothetical protein